LILRNSYTWPLGGVQRRPAQQGLKRCVRLPRAFGCCSAAFPSNPVRYGPRVFSVRWRKPHLPGGAGCSWRASGCWAWPWLAAKRSGPRPRRSDLVCCCSRGFRAHPAALDLWRRSTPSRRQLVTRAFLTAGLAAGRFALANGDGGDWHGSTLTCGVRHGGQLHSACPTRIRSQKARP